MKIAKFPFLISLIFLILCINNVLTLEIASVPKRIQLFIGTINNETSHKIIISSLKQVPTKAANSIATIEPNKNMALNTPISLGKNYRINLDSSYFFELHSSYDANSKKIIIKLQAYARVPHTKAIVHNPTGDTTTELDISSINAVDINIAITGQMKGAFSNLEATLSLDSSRYTVKPLLQQTAKSIADKLKTGEIKSEQLQYYPAELKELIESYK